MHESLESGVDMPMGKTCEYLRTHVCIIGVLQVRTKCYSGISPPPMPAKGKRRKCPYFRASSARGLSIFALFLNYSATYLALWGTFKTEL